MQSGVQICGVWCEMCNVVFPLANKLLEKSAKFWPKYKILLFVRGLLWGVECGSGVVGWLCVNKLVLRILCGYE